MTGGALVYIRNDMICETIGSKIYDNCVWIIDVCVKRNNKSMRISVVYRSPSSSKRKFLDLMSEWIENGPDIFVNWCICGDMNIDMSNINECYAKQLVKFFEFYGMKQIVTEPTRITINTTTLIDVIFTNVANMKANVLEDEKISDHETLQAVASVWESTDKKVNMVSKVMNYTANRIIQKLNEYNWQIYRLPLVEKIAIISDRLNESVRSFVKVVPSKYIENKWYNTELRELQKKRNEANKKAIRTKEDNDWHSYKNLRNQYIKKIREAKQNHIQQNLKKACGDSKQTWKILKGMINGKKTSEINKMTFGNEIETDPSVIANKYNSFVINSIREVHESIQDIHNDENITHMNNNCFTDFYLPTKDEIFGIIDNMKKKTDTQMLSSKIVVDAWPVVGDAITHIMNECLLMGCCPDLWKISTIVPVPKVGKATNSNDFRPINMLCTLEKVLETIVKNQLMTYIDEKNILVSQQAGYRRNYSCESSINIVLSDWKMIKDQNEHIVCVFLDLKRAFETVDRIKLLNKLKEYGIGGVVHKWLDSFLTKRKQKVKINGVTSNELEIDLGTPQGAILSAFLFILYINDMPNNLKHCRINLFADDTLIYMSGTRINDIIGKVNEDLSGVFKWLCVNKLKLNVEKTKYMIIKGTNSRTHDADVSVKINNERLECVDTMKYLGVLIDNQLKFKKNCEYVCKKAAKKIGLLGRLSRYLTTNAKINIYKSIISPHFEYCPTILFMADCADMSAFQKLQNRAMRVILRCNRYTSIKEMLNGLQFMSIRQIIIARTLQFIYKMKIGKIPQCASLMRTRGELHTYPTRSRDNFRLPKTNKTCTQNSLFFKGTKIFNTLPNEIKNEPNEKRFKKQIIKYVKEKYF